ncbi:MAG: ATP-binding protein [Treponema sp.]|nr:ATP-binding protein [Treponema sp.]
MNEPPASPSYDRDGNSPLHLENQQLRDEVSRLAVELKKNTRELDITKRLLDKVTNTVKAKDTLSIALSEMNTLQRGYTDMLLESCPNIILLFDANGRIVLSTKVFLTATNTPNFDYIKNLYYEEILERYFSDDNMKTFRAAAGKAIAFKEIVTFDATVDFTNSGNPRLFSVEMRCAGTGRENNSILMVMVDITDIMHEKQRAEAASNAKSNFLAAMSHEIRTPMNAIIGLGEILNRTELNGMQKKYVSNICQSSNALLQIINEILDFSAIEVGKMKLVHINYNLKEVLENLYAIFLVPCQNKNLTFEFRLAENLPEMARGDETRLRQTLANILSNAIKYTRKGGIAFSAWLDESNMLRFDVKDSGIGIREEDKADLFRPFERFDLTENRNIGGTGLGLSICHSLCKVMGGHITVESVYGEGSTFSVFLPYIKPEQSAKKDVRAVFDFKAPCAKILVIDDIDINLEVAEAILGAFEITPVLACDGLRAIELAKEHRYDIIFVDHLMPEMDGLETTRNIRKLGGWNETVPIIALTANAIEGMEQIFLSNQMNDCLFKPIDIPSLNVCLRKWLPPQLIEPV